MSRGLTIELPSPSVATLRAVEALLREPRLKAKLRVIRAPRTAPSSGVLRIESASLVRPVLTVLWGDEQALEHSPEDARVALSREIWADDAAPEPWRVTAEPLPTRARVLGRPDRDRPWVLMAPSVRMTPAQAAALTGAEDCQLHFIGLAAPSGPGRPVCWLPQRRAISALLGKVDAVIAPPGPLAWDAERAGVPVFQPPARDSLPTELMDRRLTRTVPATLVGDANFWRRVADGLLGGTGFEWGTAAWVLHARARANEPRHPSHRFKLGSARRKLGKLRRDPAAFWADSWVVRCAGRVLRAP